MKPQIALTPDQMQELQSLGLDCSDASMCWYVMPNDKTHRQLCVHDEYCWEVSALKPVPAYTIEDIIFKLEADITYNDVIANKPDTFAGQPVEKTPWECSYSHLVGFATLEHTLCCGLCWGKTPMEAAFNALKKVQECFPDKIKKLER